MEVTRYTPDKASQWDAFVRSAKNATFLHLRGYLDYHSDRFADNSLIFRRNGKIVALLPANRVDNTLFSHQGLTYGGFLTQAAHFGMEDMLEVGEALKAYVAETGIDTLVYKPVPHIYHTYPAEEDLYLMFRLKAQIATSGLSSVIDIENRAPFNENAKRAVKHATAQGVVIEQSTDFAAFWKILSEVLHTRHGVSPVHTIDEIEMLHERFPEQIRLYTATCNGEIVAGTVLYDTGRVAHAQYIAASEQGRLLKALPLLFKRILENECRGNRYFDFGISTENGGLTLNTGLDRQKYGMGGRGVVYNSYIVKF